MLILLKINSISDVKWALYVKLTCNIEERVTEIISLVDIEFVPQ